jgi:phosphoribosylformylglycinamidine cyclo-ligase
MTRAKESTSSATLSYDQAGVDYDLIDPLKVAAQRAAAGTGAHLAAHGFREVAASRGESAYVVDVGPFYLASIVECLGSKALVADEITAHRSYYDAIAQDTIAMAITASSRSAPPISWCGRTGQQAAPTGSPTATCTSARAVEARVRPAASRGRRRNRHGRHRRRRPHRPRRHMRGLVNRKSACRSATARAGDAIVLLASSGTSTPTDSAWRSCRAPAAGAALAGGPGLRSATRCSPPPCASPVTEALYATGVPHYCANITGRLAQRSCCVTGRAHVPHHTVPADTGV